MFRIDLGAQSYYSSIGVSTDATPAEIRDACAKLQDELDRKRRKADDEPEKLDARAKEISSILGILARKETREKYDRENAHLKFFLLRSAAAPTFTDCGDRLVVLHRVLRDFLRARGVEAAPLSDFDRTDFSEDLTPNELFDKLLGET